MLEKNKDKLVEESGKQFLENSGLKIYNFLENNKIGLPITFASEYEMNEGNYTGKIDYEISIINCINIEMIIPNISRLIDAEFIKMSPLNKSSITNDILDGTETNCYVFIFRKYV